MNDSSVDGCFMSVKGLVRILQESEPKACEALGIKYEIPFDSDDEAEVLTSLDQARKAYDQELALSGREPGTRDLHQALVERVILNSLRKWQSNVYSYVEEPGNPIAKKLVNVTRQLARKRKREAIDGFVQRNRDARDRLITRNGRGENVFLLLEMSRVVRVMLHDFLNFYWAAEPKFGDGAVYERIPMLARWERLDAASLEESDLPWSRAACTTSARLCAVAKQWDKDRLITVEPSDSTWLQHKARLALGRTLIHNGFERIVDQGLSRFDGPKYHRKRALDASVVGSDSSTWGTLDLSNASDGITWDQVTSVFPPEVSAILDRCRSPYFQYKRECGFVETEELHMYGGMGNATTFMVESILFYALIRASCCLRGCAFRGASVVGDDLLVNGLEQVDATIWGLNTLGYNINKLKSFHGLENPVRESCGCWAFNGHDIYVPAYLGYSGAGSQRLALAEYVRQVPKCLEYSFLVRLGDWANMPVKVANTISVCDPTRVVTWDRIRWNRRLFKLEARLETAETPSVCLPADYSCSPEGARAVLTRQVTTAPECSNEPTASLYQARRRATIIAARQRLRDQYTRRWYVSLNGCVTFDGVFTDAHEDMLDILLREVFNTSKWRLYLISLPDPYRTKLADRWVALSEPVPDDLPPWVAAYKRLLGL